MLRIAPLLALLSASCVSLSDRPWTGRFIEPVSAGTTFESPVIDTNLELHVVDQSFPTDSIFGGGGFDLYALQARFAVSDRLAIIATKDGYIDLKPAMGASESGIADVGGGVKYAAYVDEESGVIVSPGIIFETELGDDEVFQGNGDGVVRPFVSAGWDRGKTNVLAAVGYNHPLDDDAESSSIDYHVHVSHEVSPGLFPLLEVNGITYTGDGSALAADFEGGDLINLGAADVSGNTVVWGAAGVAYTLNERTQLGIVYEWPWTSREDLMEDRIWFSLLWRF